MNASLTAAKLLVPSYGELESAANPLDLFIHPRECQLVPYCEHDAVGVWRMKLHKLQVFHLIVSSDHSAMSDGVAEGNQIEIDDLGGGRVERLEQR